MKNMENKNKNVYILLGIIFFTIINVLISFIKKDNELENPEIPIQKLESICFSDDKIDLIVGEEYNLELEFMPENLTENIEYSSSNPNIISVNKNGVVKALKEGNSIITVKSESGLTSEITVTSEQIILVEDEPYVAVSQIVINDNEITVQSGKSYTIKTNVLPQNATNKSLIWETDDTRIATVTDDGIVTGRTAGTTTLTAYSENNKYAKIKVTVKSPAVSLSDIELNPSSISLELNDTYQLKTTFIPSNALITDVKYTSANSSIVKVSNTGLITAVGKGTTVVSVSSNGKTSSATVTVVSKSSVIKSYSISINQNNLNLKVGQTSSLTVTINPSNTTNKNYIWTSSNTNVATVSNKGVIKAVSKGNATITVATIDGKKDTISVNVTETEEMEQEKINLAKEILLSISSVKLKGGETKQVRATILPLSASQEVEWISGAPSIATVNENGVITGIKNGTTTIAAMTKNGLVARIKVTVQAHDEYKDSEGYACLTPYTCFKQTKYGGNFCSTANCGPISSKGCSVTSWSTILSMFVQNENGKPYNPIEVTYIMNHNGLCSRYCSGDDAAKKVFQYFGLSVSETYKTKDANDRQKLIEHLKEGNPALLRVGAGCYTKVGHIMAILAINDSGLVWLYDPSSSKKSNRNTWISLDEILSCCGSSSWFILVGPGD